MGFNTNTVRSITAGAADDSWKATAFVNLYIKGAEGRRKLGAIALKDSKAFEKAVIERLTKGGPDAIAALMAVLEIDFVRADAEVPVSTVGF